MLVFGNGMVLPTPCSEVSAERSVMMIEPVVLPSGYCFACRGEMQGYGLVCPYCNGRAEVMQLREAGYAAYQMIMDLEDQVDSLTKVIAKLRRELTRAKRAK